MKKDISRKDYEDCMKYCCWTIEALVKALRTHNQL